MRTHEFEFKKTVKTVKKFKTISVDLTVEDAEILLYCIKYGSVDEGDEGADDSEKGFPKSAQENMFSLKEALEAFLAKNGVYVE